MFSIKEVFSFLMAFSILATFPLFAETGGGCNAQRLAGMYISQFEIEPIIDATTGEKIAELNSIGYMKLGRDGTVISHGNAINAPRDEVGELVEDVERTSYNESPSMGTWVCSGPRTIRVHTHIPFSSNSHPFGTPAERFAPFSTVSLVADIAFIVEYVVSQDYNELIQGDLQMAALYFVGDSPNDPAGAPFTFPVEGAVEVGDVKYERMRNFIPLSN